MFAKNESSHKHLSQQFEARQTTKIYQGLVLGSLSQSQGTLDSPIAEHPVKKGSMVVNRKGREAITDYEVIQDFKLYSWIQFRIHTGRTHQIRVHMKDAGHPIACDELYGDGKPILLSSFKSRFKLSKNVEEERPLLSRLALHSYQLIVETDRADTINLEAPLPKDLAVTLKQLAKK
jgi:23S rRNA pseudouridine1911/1915/1917 synthase